MFRGRTGAEAQLHSVAHMFERTGRRLPFQSVHIHVQRCLWDSMPVMRPAVSGGGISSVVLREGTALYVDLDADLAAIDDLCLEPFSVSMAAKPPLHLLA
jgi:hypothetical protein